MDHIRTGDTGETPKINKISYNFGPNINLFVNDCNEASRDVAMAKGGKRVAIALLAIPIFGWFIAFPMVYGLFAPIKRKALTNAANKVYQIDILLNSQRAGGLGLTPDQKEKLVDLRKTLEKQVVHATRSWSDKAADWGDWLFNNDTYNEDKWIAKGRADSGSYFSRSYNTVMEDGKANDLDVLTREVLRHWNEQTGKSH